MLQPENFYNFQQAMKILKDKIRQSQPDNEKLKSIIYFNMEENTPGGVCKFKPKSTFLDTCL